AAAKPVVRKTPAAKKPLRIPSAPPLEKLLLRGPLRAKASALTKLVRPTIRFALHPDPSIQIGQSRFGGLPDLPKGLGWPGPHGKKRAGRETIRFTSCSAGRTRFKTTWRRIVQSSRAAGIGSFSFNSIRRRTPV